MSSRVSQQKQCNGCGFGSNTFHANVVIEDYVEPPINVEEPNLINITLCNVNLEQVDNWIVNNGSKHGWGTKKDYLIKYLVDPLI